MQGQPWLHGKFVANLGYKRACLAKTAQSQVTEATAVTADG